MTVKFIREETKNMPTELGATVNAWSDDYISGIIAQAERDGLKRQKKYTEAEK